MGKPKLTNKAKIRPLNKGFCPPKVKLENEPIELKKSLTKTLKAGKSKFDH